MTPKKRTLRVLFLWKELKESGNVFCHFVKQSIGERLFSYQNLSANLNKYTMTTFHENHSNVLEENLTDILPGGSALAFNPEVDILKPYNLADGSANTGLNDLQAVLLNDYKSFENTADFDLTAGPGDEDDDDDDDDDDFLDDEDETLIPIEGDEEDDDLLSADEDEDVIPGTDLDDDNLDEDDDLYDEDSTTSRSTLGDIGSNNTSRDTGRTTGRMIDHEPGTTDI